MLGTSVSVVVPDSFNLNLLAVIVALELISPDAVILPFTSIPVLLTVNLRVEPYTNCKLPAEFVVKLSSDSNIFVLPPFQFIP